MAPRRTTPSEEAARHNWPRFEQVVKSLPVARAALALEKLQFVHRPRRMEREAPRTRFGHPDRTTANTFTRR